MMKFLISFIAILATSCTARIATTAVPTVSSTASQTPSPYHIPTLVPAPPHAAPSTVPSPQSVDVPTSGTFAEGWINQAVTVGTALAGVVFVSVALM
nr:hypothetical protein [Tanacetum cinerariifolium]